MFGNKSDKSTQNNAGTAAGNISNSIVEGTEIIGDIKALNDIRIDGFLKGNLDCKGRVILGVAGKIEGNIECANAIIEGSILGNISVKELLTIKEQANINGEIVTDKLFIHNGATFNGTCSMSGHKNKVTNTK